jgi:hypothetical protein
MAVEYNLEITDRVQTNSATLKDGSVVSDYIEAIVCVLIASEDGVTAGQDLWVSLSDANTVEASDFVAFNSLTELPDKIKTQLEAWGNDEDLRQQLSEQIAAQKLASVEKVSPWS